MQLDISTFFSNVPILKDWYTSLKQKVYFFSTYNPSPLLSDLKIRGYILNVNNAVERLIDLMQKKIIKVRDYIDFKNTTLTHVDNTLHDLSALRKQIQNIIDELDTLVFSDMKLQVDELFIMLSDVESQFIFFFFMKLAIFYMKHFRILRSAYRKNSVF